MGANINKITVVLALGLLSGLFFTPIFGFFSLFIIFVCLFLFAFAFLRHSFVFLSLAIFALAFWVGSFYFTKDDERRVSSFSIEEKKEITIQCFVFGDIEIKNDKKRFQCRPFLKEKIFREKFLIYTQNISENFLHGDLLTISGVFERPKPFVTDTGNIFEYDEFLKTKDVFYISFDSKIKNIVYNKKNFRQKLFVFRDFFIKPFSKGLSGNNEGLFMGLLFGQNILSNDLTTSFRISGLTHIIALSGYNITVIASWVKSFFGQLGARVSSVFSIFSIILFILMTGVPITAVRAGIMAGISLIALRSGNQYLSLRALFLAVLIMNLINPRLIYFDFSFQLSVLATLGIILFTPKFQKLFSNKIPSFLKEIIITTISAQIIVLPLILFKTKLLSVLSLPANIFVLPLVPIIMFLGFLGGLVGMLFSPFSFPFVFISNLGIEIIIKLSHFFSSFLISSFIFKDFGLILMIFLYILLSFWFFKKKVSIDNLV